MNHIYVTTSSTVKLKKIYRSLIATFSLLLVFSSCLNAQLIYQNNNLGSRIYNPGVGSSNTPVILFDDVNIASSVIGNADSLVVNQVNVAIGRAPGAPAVIVNVYATTVNPLTDTFPVVPAKLIGTLNLPAGGPSNFFSVGDGSTPLFVTAADTGNVFAGYQTILIGLSFSDSLPSNGWYLSEGADYNYGNAFRYNQDRPTDSISSFNFYGTYNLPASFFTEVYGTTKFTDPLPIILNSFNVSRKDNTNLLTWITQSESNSDYFGIERSDDGIRFTQIAKVKAAGNSNAVLNYIYTDNIPATATKYYRIHLVGKDNHAEYSPIRNIKGKGGIVYTTFPNPVINKINISIESGNADAATISVSDVSGKVLTRKSYQLAAGKNILDIDMSAYGKGFYLLKIQSGSNTFIKKLVKN